MPIYVIEHLEPTVGKWALIEYRHISEIVGSGNLWFTNIKRKNPNLEKIGRVFRESVSKLDLKNACVLDPQTDKILAPAEAKQFDYFIFGGILGDYPPKKRTKKELTQFVRGVEVRNIGKKQFSTDNAVYVTNQIVHGTPMDNMKFKYKIEIKINEVESIILPYLYPIVEGKPLMSPRLLSFLKRKKGF